MFPLTIAPPSATYWNEWVQYVSRTFMWDPFRYEGLKSSMRYYMDSYLSWCRAWVSPYGIRVIAKPEHDGLILEWGERSYHEWHATKDAQVEKQQEEKEEGKSK
jgi:hypothetical protein